MHVSMHSNRTITMKHFDSIIQHLKKIDAIHQISAVLSWDQETYMPKGSIDARAKQLETLAGIDHDYWQDPTLADDIHRFIDPKTSQPLSIYPLKKLRLFVNCMPHGANIRRLANNWCRN